MPDRPLRGLLPRVSLAVFVGVALAIQGAAALAEALPRWLRAVVVVRCDYGWALVVGPHRWDWWSPSGWARWEWKVSKYHPRPLRLGPLGVITRSEPM